MIHNFLKIKKKNFLFGSNKWSNKWIYISISFFLFAFLKTFNAMINERNLSKLAHSQNINSKSPSYTIQQSISTNTNTNTFDPLESYEKPFTKTQVPDLIVLFFPSSQQSRFDDNLNEREPPSPLPSPYPSVERSLRFADRRDVLKRARRSVKRVPTHRSLYGHT